MQFLHSMVHPTSSLEGKEGKEASSSWCTFPSVLDVQAPDPLVAPPFDPPVAMYLEEALLGVRQGLGDASVPRHEVEAALPLKGLSCSVARMAMLLQETLTCQPAVLAGRSLFWLAMGAIFGCLPEEAAAEVRAELGRNWHLLTLQVEERMPNHRDVRDWAIAAAPFVIAQALYRLLCDGFDEDRKHFLTQGSKLIQKLTLIVHFELTGFQLTVDTIRQARRRLFLQRVLSSPHVNQRDYLKGVRRQEVLESKKDAGPRMLDFGRKDAPHMDQAQLEHILQGRAAKMKQQLLQMSMTPSAKSAPLPTENTWMRDDLSVDRHLHLNDVGTMLIEQHLSSMGIKMKGNDDFDYDEDLARKNGGEQEDGETDPEPDSPVSSSPVATRAAVPSRPHLQSFMSRQGTVKWLDGGASSDDGNSERERPATSAAVVRAPATSTDDGETNAELPSLKLKKQRSLKRMGAQRVNPREAAMQKKESDAKARRQRQDLLQHKLVVEPLPAEMCTRQIKTDWVSPALQYMMGDTGDRDVLCKTHADSFHLKMFTKPIPARPLSMPALKASTRPQSKGHGETKRRPHDAMTVSQTSAKEEGSLAGGSSRAAARTIASVHSERDASNAPMSTSASSPGLHPWTSSATGQSHGSAGVINMDSAVRISGKVIKQRLEGQAKAFRQNSFAQYIKEFDVFSGKLKQSFDEKRLRDEEDACLRKAENLIGGPPRRLIRPAEVRIASHTHHMGHAGLAGHLGAPGQLSLPLPVRPRTTET